MPRKGPVGSPVAWPDFQHSIDAYHKVGGNRPEGLPDWHFWPHVVSDGLSHAIFTVLSPLGEK